MSLSQSSQNSPPPVINMGLDSPDSSRIRANFLNKLGIDDDKKEQPKVRSPSRGSLLGKVQTRQEPLKYKEDEEEHPKANNSPWTHFFGVPSEDASLASSPDSASTGSLSTKGKEARITFNSEVKVVPIPMRDEYSKRVKDRLWTNVDDLAFNAQRNAIEFAAEGWNWRTALEDENMYRDSVSGELIHPIHCMQQLPSDEY